MLSLLELLAQNQPHFQTHQALLIIGLQNEFVRPDGKLPVDSRSGYIERIRTLIPRFRQNSGKVIWVQTLFDTERSVNDPSNEGDTVVLDNVDGAESEVEDDDDDLPKELMPATPSRSKHKQRALDLLKKVSSRKRAPARAASPLPVEEDELFLTKSKKGPCCIPDTPGSDFAEVIKPCIEQSTDTVVRTTHYSAFNGTSLLVILRAKLVTKLYICGCLTNISVFATVLDAARHGIEINVIGDCLGYRKQSRHDEALGKMVDYIEARVVSSDELGREQEQAQPPQPDSDAPLQADDELNDLVGNLRLEDEDAAAGHESGPRPRRRAPPSIAVNGRQRTLSDASVAESRTTVDTTLSDDQFSDMLVQGARTSYDRGSLSGRPSSRMSQESRPNMVKSKIRMRSRSDKSKKDKNSESKSKDSKDSKVPAASKASSPKATMEAPPQSPTKSASQNKLQNLEETVPKRDPKKTTEALEPPPRAPAITKAESSDKLRETPSRRDQKLKSSVSQPTLSSRSSDKNKTKGKESKERFSLTRSLKSDHSAPTASTPPKSPAKVPSTPSTMGKKVQSLATFPVLGPEDTIAEGDSRVVYDFFSPTFRHPTDRTNALKDVIFRQLYNEVRWQKMYHAQGEVPRLVCVQGEFGADGSMPVYRHPSDQVIPLLHFSPKVHAIRKQAEKLVGHKLNHVLIQLYRSGQDFISEHSDKTLDIVRGSRIVNVSFGAQRIMRLRTKKSATEDAADQAGSQRNTQRVAMPHNSMFVLGQESNMKWLHGINPDKRAPSERSEAEKAYSGMRISLTFRHIGTFLDSDSRLIWGQGATSEDRADAQDVINNAEEETEKIIRAFSKENHSTAFDWNAVYGHGFDVLHFQTPPEDIPILFTSNNSVENHQIEICLAELGLKHTVSEMPICEKEYEFDRQVAYRDTNTDHTEIISTVPILLYLDRYHTLDRSDSSHEPTATSYDLFLVLSALRKYWVNRAVPTVLEDLINMLDSLEERHSFSPGPYIAGRRFSTADCFMWPILDEIVEQWERWSRERYPTLTEYYEGTWKRKKSVGRLRAKLPKILGAAVVGGEVKAGAGCAGIGGM